MLLEDLKIPPSRVGIPRKDMPQIESKKVPQFIKYLGDNGVAVERSKESVKKLHITQLDINKEKVHKMLDAPDEVLKKIIIVSSDNYILDGHHRFVALLNKDPSAIIPIYRVHAKIIDLIKLARDFGGVFFKNIRESLIPFSNFLNEKLIVFGGRAYPKFGQIVILAGGAGSGKGFITSKLLGIEGRILDVDALKLAAMASTKIRARVKSELGIDLDSLKLKDSENVARLHNIVANELKLDARLKSAVIASAIEAPKDRKPNIIFDVTMKNLKKLKTISSDAMTMGYDKENIHIVWVLNDIEMAIEQNAKRDRVVPSEILADTHEGAAKTMKEIMNMGSELAKYMDGDIYIAANKFKVDSTLVMSKTGSVELDSDDMKIFNQKVSKNSGSYISKSDYFQIKVKGKRIMSYPELEPQLIAKIKSYIPNPEIFE